uniref:Uncharacterized protein n=1 Tax=Meloidogyne enterolobii TaxID=390850 RepID=A0A6V7WRA2_MELEN|nr:unnamed protein product [Meloidogyne enterolobii]
MIFKELFLNGYKGVEKINDDSILKESKIRKGISSDEFKNVKHLTEIKEFLLELATELEKIINSLYLELDYKKRSGKVDPNTALKTGSKLMSEILKKFGSEIEEIEEKEIEKIEEKENDPLTLSVSPEIIAKKEKNIPLVPKLSDSPEMIGKKKIKRERGVGTPVPSPRGVQKKVKTIINITPSKSTHKKNGDQAVTSPSVPKKKKKVHFTPET